MSCLAMYLYSIHLPVDLRVMKFLPRHRSAEAQCACQRRLDYLHINSARNDARCAYRARALLALAS